MTIITSELELNELLDFCPKRITPILKQLLDPVPALELKEAMDYSLFNGGKHIRPLLVYATGSIFNANLAHLDIPACAVELIHAYSLVHDDLPSMDNANLRRGKPTCHKAYGEGMAVLVGDGLQTLAFQFLAHSSNGLNAEKRTLMLTTLARAAGPYGMVAGQALDISVLQDEKVSSDLLFDIYHFKTGDLISACIELGRLASKDDDEINHSALAQFGDCIGLAFQIQDDILDIEASSERLGKQKGMDHQNKKMTYPKLFGLNEAREQVQALYQRALEAIDYLGHKAKLLRDLTGYMLQRKH